MDGESAREECEKQKRGRELLVIHNGNSADIFYSRFFRGWMGSLGWQGCACVRVCVYVCPLLFGLSLSLSLISHWVCAPLFSVRERKGVWECLEGVDPIVSYPCPSSHLPSVCLCSSSRPNATKWWGTRQGCVSFFLWFPLFFRFFFLFLPSCSVAKQKKKKMFPPLFSFLLIRRATLCSWTSMQQDFAWQARHGTHLHLLSCVSIPTEGNTQSLMQGICCRLFLSLLYFCIKHNCESKTDHLLGPHGPVLFSLSSPVGRTGLWVIFCQLFSPVSNGSLSYHLFSQFILKRRSKTTQPWPERDTFVSTQRKPVLFVTLLRC